MCTHRLTYTLANSYTYTTYSQEGKRKKAILKRCLWLLRREEVRVGASRVTMQKTLAIFQREMITTETHKVVEKVLEDRHLGMYVWIRAFGSY